MLNLALQFETTKGSQPTTMMKIRIRNRKITKSIDIDNECKLNDLRQFIFGLFDNTFPRLIIYVIP